MKLGFNAIVLAFLTVGLLGGVAFGGGVLYGRNTAPVTATIRVRLENLRIFTSISLTDLGRHGGPRTSVSECLARYKPWPSHLP